MKRCKIRNLVDIKKGDYITKNKSNEGDYPVILGGKEPAYYIDKYNHVGKAIVISRSGASAGYVSFWNEPIFITDGFLVEPKEGFSHEYIYYVLKSRQTQLHNMQNGSAIPHITPTLINMLDVDLHEKKDREIIVSILLSYDEIIENNNKRIKILEQMAENLYREWFVRFRFPGHENVEFKNGIPMGWEIKGLFEITNIKYGYAFSSDAFCNDDSLSPVVRIRDIQNNRTNTFTAEKCDEKYLIKENDILVGMDGIFHMCLWCGGTAYLNQRVVEICSKDSDVICNYLLFFSIYPQVKFWEQTISGTTVAHLGDKHLKKMKIIIPDRNTLHKINSIMKNIMNEIRSLRKKNDNLTRQRDLLLPRLMSGRLQVK